MQIKPLLLEGEIKDYNVMTVGKIFFDQPVKKDLKAYDKNYHSSKR